VTERAPSRTTRRVTPVDFDPFTADVDVATVPPLSEAQQEIWAVTQLGPEESCAYNLCYALRLSGELSWPALQAAIRQLLDRHEALRTTFEADGHGQTIQPPPSWDQPPLDLTSPPPKGSSPSPTFSSTRSRPPSTSSTGPWLA